jgi:hypothetical protein
MSEKLKVVIVVLMGGVGGILSWIYGCVIGSPLAVPWWQAIPASAFLGMGASFLGVYALANCDTRRYVHALAFALLCGFSWKPVYDASAALFQKKTEEAAQHQKAELALVSARRLDAQVRTAATAPSRLDVAELVRDASDVIAALPDIKDPDLRDHLQTSVASSVELINRVAPEEPKVAIDALQVIGDAAVTKGNPGISVATISSLHSLKDNSNITAVRTQAASSVQHVQRTAEKVLKRFP